MQMPSSRYPELDDAFNLLRADPYTSIALCREYLIENSDNERALRIIYQAYRDLKNWDMALLSANDCIRTDPTNDMAYWWRGETEYRLGRYDNAIADGKQAIAFDANKTLGSMPYRLIALSYAMQGDLENALDYAGQIKELEPNEWFPPLGPLPAGTKAEFTDMVRRTALQNA